jgi:hypothetical protein
LQQTPTDATPAERMAVLIANSLGYLAGRAETAAIASIEVDGTTISFIDPITRDGYLLSVDWVPPSGEAA